MLPETRRGLSADAGVTVLNTSSSAPKWTKAARKLKSVAPADKYYILISCPHNPGRISAVKKKLDSIYQNLHLKKLIGWDR